MVDKKCAVIIFLVMSIFVLSLFSFVDPDALIVSFLPKANIICDDFRRLLHVSIYTETLTFYVTSFSVKMNQKLARCFSSRNGISQKKKHRRM